MLSAIRRIHPLKEPVEEWITLEDTVLRLLLALLAHKILNRLWALRPIRVRKAPEYAPLLLPATRLVAPCRPLRVFGWPAVLPDADHEHGHG
jgi:hypothetical protein